MAAELVVRDARDDERGAFQSVAASIATIRGGPEEALFRTMLGIALAWGALAAAPLRERRAV